MADQEWRIARAPGWLALGALFLLNGVPLVALALGPLAAPLGIDETVARAVTGFSLLPVVVLPTVALASRCSPRIYRTQYAIAAAVCLATILPDSGSIAALTIGAVTTMGTLAFTVVLIEKSRSSIAATRAHLRSAGATDPLTGALNRRGAAERLSALVAQAHAADLPLGIAAVDLDHFKRINDTHGHAVGDGVLRRVAEHARGVVGEAGVVVRSGGEELLLLTVGRAERIAEVLRARIEADSSQPAVTISVGAVHVTPEGRFGADDLWAAVDRADAALYRAKSLGRNCVVDDGLAENVRAVRPRAPVAGSQGAGSHGAGSRHRAAVTRIDGDPTTHRPTSAPLGQRGRDALEQAAERARQRTVSPELRRIYRLIVAWMMIVGMGATLQEVLAGSVPLTQLLVILPVGWIFGGAVIIWIGRVRTMWSLVPVFAVGSLFETTAVISVAPDSRPAALMLALLTALLLVAAVPHRPVLAAQLVVTIATCWAGAIVPGRPTGAIVVIAVVTGLALAAALIEVAAQYRRSERAEQVLFRIASTDPLTGVGNRRALQAFADRWRAGWIVMVDVDNFKQVNDTYGHGFGDDVLRSIADALRSAARRAAPVRAQAFRMGGDEFILIGVAMTAGASASGLMPPPTSPEECAQYREAMAQAVLAAAQLPTTVSLGAACWNRGGNRRRWIRDEDGAEPLSDLWEALATADARMLSAKRARAAALDAAEMRWGSPYP